MPPKRKNVKKKPNKQPNVIRSRLMQISLRLDDYIYNNKLITASQARAYIDEIAKLKSKCSTDVHALQVIEKLTRCMTGIIIEQQIANEENRDNTHYHEEEESKCPSPVYSLPDSDKLYSQTAVENGNKDIREIETIDISSDEDTRLDMAVDVMVHRAMSNLTITDVNIDQSQSILGDFENVGNVNIIEGSVKAKKRVTEIDACAIQTMDPLATSEQSQNIFDGFIQNTGSLCNNNKQENFNNKGQGIQNILIQNVKRNVLKAQNNCDTPAMFEVDNGTVKVVKFTPQDEIIQKSKVLEREHMKRLNKKKSSIEKNKKSTSKTNNKRKLNADSRNSDIKTSKSKGNAQNKKIVNTEKPIEIDNTQTQLKYREIFITNNSTNSRIETTTPTIYNKETENDLSWLENIRYVREITADELDLKMVNIDDSFWDNKTHPCDWNDQDFRF